MGGFAYDLERKEVTKTDIPDFQVGDTVDVHVKIKEGNKERIQIFTGVVIARNHQGMRESFTVRRLVAGEGVERVFPLHSPKVEKIEVTRRGKVRRAKLYYLRDRVGKETRITEDLKRSRENVADVKVNALAEEPEQVEEVVAEEAAPQAEEAPAQEAPTEEAAQQAEEAPAEEASEASADETSEESKEG